MAQVSTYGFSDFLREMQALGENVDEIAEEMLDAGAEVATEEWKNGIREHDYIDTGDMLASVGPNKNTKSSGRSSGARSVEIYPQGKDRKGIRNAEKAYMLHYGTSKMRGSRFVDDIDERAEQKIQEAMEKVMDEHLKKI